MSAIIGKKCNISSISSKPPIGGYRLSLIYIHYICQASKLTLTTMARKEYISRPTAQKYLNCDRNTLMKLIENDTIKHQRREDGGWQIGIWLSLGRHNFAAIDFETANSYPSSVCSVGVVIVHNGEFIERFYSLIQPEPNYYDWCCQRVHGLSEREILTMHLYFPMYGRKLHHTLRNCENRQWSSPDWQMALSWYHQFSTVFTS